MCIGAEGSFYLIIELICSPILYILLFTFSRTGATFIPYSSHGEPVVADNLGIVRRAGSRGRALIVDIGVGVVVDPEGVAGVIIAHDGTVAAWYQEAMPVGEDRVGVASMGLLVVTSSKQMGYFMPK